MHVIWNTLGLLSQPDPNYQRSLVLATTAIMSKEFKELTREEVQQVRIRYIDAGR